MNKKLLSAAIGCLMAGGMMAQAPVNDDCATAIDINSLFGGALNTAVVGGPYTNTNGTTANDPIDGWACYGEPDDTGTAPELNNTVWFTFTGDGNQYFIETPSLNLVNGITDGDTQMSLYEGTCGALTALACNEDGPNATSTYYPAAITFFTTPGVTYYLMVDGFSFNGAVSEGDFNIEVTMVPGVACGDTSVTAGTATSNGTDFCEGDTVLFTGTGSVYPTAGTVFGIIWVLSSADISNSTDPVNEPSYLGSTNVITSPNGTTTVQLVYNTANFPPNTYYITPCVFGNGTAGGPISTLADITIDPNCFFGGTSVMFTLLDPQDPQCTGAGINENGSNASLDLFPNPVSNMLTISNKENFGTAVVTITDNLGKTIDVLNMASGQALNVNTEKYPSGMYFISVSQDSKIMKGKFVKK